MIAAMAIELFVWLYALSLGAVTVISASLLIIAARHIGVQDRRLKARSLEFEVSDDETPDPLL